MEQPAALRANGPLSLYDYREARNKRDLVAAEILLECNCFDEREQDRRSRHNFSSTLCPKSLPDWAPDYSQPVSRRSKRQSLRCPFSTGNAVPARAIFPPVDL